VTFFKIVFTILAIIFTINLGDTLVQQSLQEGVYACEEVTKTDPINVQKICDRRWKRK
jgi:hypothetical protein